ncbi:hypothetical protein BDD12DRAFT_950040 [Trichophaea hybrida]|nr:hypothetical protein BDD12DRAFT_950040 [Trichophaea hybrida]
MSSRNNKKKHRNYVTDNTTSIAGASIYSSSSAGARVDSTTNNKHKQPTRAEEFASSQDEILVLPISSRSPLSLAPGSAAADENGLRDMVVNLRAFFDSLLPDTKSPLKAISNMQEATVVQEFGLTKLIPSFDLREQGWIFSEPAMPVRVSEHLTRFLLTYVRNFQRTSGALCRTATDVILNEALCCLAKRDGRIDDARGQLLGYMACVHANRQLMKRRDMDVYGIATDGYKYEFVVIDRARVVSISERVDITMGMDKIKLFWLPLFMCWRRHLK